MNSFFRFLYFAFIILISACSTSKLAPISIEKKNAPKFLESPYVVLISIDGYRFDYTKNYSPPNLNSFVKEGATAKSLIPSFPSKTYPNHYSIVTGLYPENHGIVANYFYDFNRPQNDQLYKLSNRNAVRDGSWYRGLPIWTASEQHGLLTASYFWPGDEAAIQEVRPTYGLTYDEKIPNQQRVQKVIEWLKLSPEQRPHFISLYFSDVDTAGHTFGTHSLELKEAIFKVDDAIGSLLQELKNISFPVNVIIVSDHGMQDVDSKKVEYLDDYTDLNGVTLGDLGPQVLIYDTNHNPVKLNQIYSKLKNKGKHFKIFKRQDLPKRLHYSKNERVGDLVVLADAPYSIGIHDVRFKIPKANHGYDPMTVKTMHGIFYAQGPNIKNKVSVKSFENVNIYPFIMNILGLPISKSIDGRIEVLKPILKTP